MCLTVRIRPVAPSTRAKRRPLKPVEGSPHVVSIRDGAYEISPDGTCGCALLTEDADWNDPTWSMRPGMRDPLAKTVDAVLNRLGNDALFEALWAGEPFQEERAVTPAQLLACIQEGRLGTRTRYRISPGAAG